MSSLNDNLNNAFKQNRVVFWYDPQDESHEQFEEANIPGVEKVVMAHDAFAQKYRILRKEKDQKFLLYFPYPRPEDSENWLLDVELSNFIFDTEQSAIFLQEMGLDYTYKTLVQQHIAFFASKERREQFRELFNSTDSLKILKYKMLSVVLGTDNYDLQTLVQSHANSYFSNLEKINRDLQRFALTDFLWEEIKDRYGYQADEKNIYEFIIQIFENSFPLTQKGNLAPDARLILFSWRDSYTMRDSYREMSAKIAEVLQIQSLLETAPLDKILEDELYELTDQKIIFELVNGLLQHSISTDRFQKIIKTRESKFWFLDYKHLYKALEHAWVLIEQSDLRQMDFDHPEQAIKSYVQEGYQMDFHYRKFYEHLHQAKHPEILKRLTTNIENIYVNDWLFAAGNNWQRLLNEKKQWDFFEFTMQSEFFKSKVNPVLEKQKVVVVISDALRYECGTELTEKINRMSKYNAELGFMISSLPSYTQLGMASLLPHSKLAFDGNTDQVLVDGLSATGTENREKILTYNTNKAAKALRVEDFKLMKNNDRRALIRDTEILYLYANQIDKTGDDKMTEGKVFDAASEEIRFLADLVRDLTSANASRILITADHGFIYQNSEVKESDFIETTFRGDFFKANRRFVLGTDLAEEEAAVKYAAKDLGIASEADILVAKGIRRFKVKGAGSRFVHGGASLQEIIIPVLDVTKGREETTSQVEIDIIQSYSKITTNALPIEFVQKQPISERVLPREIRAFIRAKDGKVLSDAFSFIFDFTGTENQQRSKRFTFQMHAEASSSYRNQIVYLILESPIEGTSRWQEYKEFAYTLNISFTNDFEL